MVRKLLPCLMLAMLCWIGALGSWHWHNLKTEAAAEQAQRQHLAQEASLRASRAKETALKSEVADTQQRISHARSALRAQALRLTEAKASIKAVKAERQADEQKTRELAAASKAAAAKAAAAIAVLEQAKAQTKAKSKAHAAATEAAAASDAQAIIMDRNDHSASVESDDLKIDSYVKNDCTDNERSKDGLILSVHYDGTYTTGEKFDSSRDRGEPFKFSLGSSSVIKGWDQGLGGMCIGDKRKLTVPKDMAYGKDVMLFDVELMGLATPLESLEKKCAGLGEKNACGTDEDCEIAAGKCTGATKWKEMWAKEKPWWYSAETVDSGGTTQQSGGTSADSSSAPSHDIVYGGKPVQTIAPRITERFDCQGFHFQMGAYTPPAAACFRKMREKKDGAGTYNPKLEDVFELGRSLSCERYLNVLLVSNSQNCFLDNYVTNVNKVESFPVIVSIATDIGAYEACQKLSASPALSKVILLCAQSPKMSATNVVIGKHDYGTQKFGAVAWQKVPTITLALKMGLGIMLTDIDMIWLHNPSPYLLYSDTVIETQCHQCMPADNLGIIVAFPGTQHIIDSWERMSHRQSNDNDAFRQAMTGDQKRDGKAYMHCMPRKSFGFAIGLGDEKLAKDGTDFYPWKEEKHHEAPNQLTRHYIASSDKTRDMQRDKLWDHTFYGPETCTLKSGLFSCDDC